MKKFIATLLLTPALTGCAQFVERMKAYDQQQALALQAQAAQVRLQVSNECEAAGYTLASGLNAGCIDSTIAARQQAAQARQQQSQEALAAGVQLWAAGRAGAAMGAQQSTYGHGEAALTSQQWSNYRNQCDYLTPSGMVSVVVSGSCPATYRY